MGRRITDEEAFEFWTSLMFLPSLPHSALSASGSERSPSGLPCPGVCLLCQQPVSPTWDNVQRTLQPCVYCAGLKLDDAVATGKVLALDICVPLEPFPGSSAPWKVKCLGCTKETSTTYSRLVNGERGACSHCGGLQGGRTRALRNLESCYAVLADGRHDGYRILDHEMRGPDNKRQLYIQVLCPQAHEYWVYAYSWKTGTLCASCREQGFRPDAPSYVYVVAGAGWLKVGISNEGSLDNRLAAHAEQGLWQRLYLIAFDSGRDAQSVELLWKSGFIPTIPSDQRATHVDVPDGFSETTADSPIAREWIRSRMVPYAQDVANGVVVPVRQQLCDVVPCGKLAMAARYQAMCSMHATRQRLHKSPYVVITERRTPPPDGLCTITDCTKPHLARGFCRAHYQADRRIRLAEKSGTWQS